MGHICCGRGNHGKKPAVNAELIGLTVEAFEAKVGADNVLVVSDDSWKDQSPRAFTADFNPKRYRVSVVGGKVANYRMG